MRLPDIIAHGSHSQGGLVWFFWNPLRWCFWRWPKVERDGQFGRYFYRFRFGPIDGKWRNHPPEQTQLGRIY